MTFIDIALSQSGYRLFSTYRVLEEAHRTFDARRPPYNKIKRQIKTRKMEDDYTDASLENTIQRMMQTGYQNQEAEILRELQAARRIRKKAEAKLQAELQTKLEEEENVRRAEAEGTMSECGCCFCEYPLNRMVHCNHEVLMHWFCRGCAKQNADTEIGNSKYHLGCMSMDVCDAGFSLEQRYVLYFLSRINY
jgi:TRIAD3 protein (E3 ubiquitin-protein ligase RNF216)